MARVKDCWSSVALAHLCGAATAGDEGSRIRHNRIGKDGHQDKPPGDGNRHDWIRTSFQSDVARLEGPIGPTTERLRSRAAILRCGRRVWKPSSCGPGVETNSAR